MAKALLGHLGGVPDARMISEVRRLRDRVRNLEHEVAVLQEAHAARAHETVSHEVLSHEAREDALSVSVSEQREPAYT